MRFKDRCVVVTGAGRGIGRGCSLAFAAEGAEVILIARNATELSALESEIEAAGGRARAVPLDVTHADEVQRFFESLARCDVLINNAGTNNPQPFLDVDLATLDTILNLNVRSMFVTAQAAARVMAKQRSGSIVHMSSQMGHIGGINRTVYCTSKHAIEGLTKSMALDLASFNIRVNAIAPTYIETPLTAPYFQNESFRQKVLSSIPLGRIGRIEEVVSAVLFLASPEASLITGTSLLVDGGYTAQ